MKAEDKKVGFDLSALSLEEVIKVYEDISDFIKFLESKKIFVENKEKRSHE